MVVVTCSLSRTMRRVPPTVDATPYRQQLFQFMQRICGQATAHINTSTDASSQNQKSYEDKEVQIRFDVNSSSRVYSQAANTLLSAYRRELAALENPENYWFDIQPDPSLTDAELSAYFFDVDISTFQLGFMSGPVDFLSYFDYQRELYMKTGQRPKATLEVDTNKLKIDFAVSQGMRFIKQPPGTISRTTEVYRLQIDFKDVSPALLVSSNRNSSEVDVCFLLTTPAQLWRTQYNLTGMDRRSFEKTSWIRTGDIRSAAVTSVGTNISSKTIGGCNALILRFAKSAQTETILNSLYQYASFYIYNTALNYQGKIDMDPAPYLDVDISTVETDLINWLLAAIHSIGFRVQYQLTGQVKDRFMNIVHALAISIRDDGHDDKRYDRRHLANALSKTYDVIVNDADRFYHLDRVLKHFVDQSRETSELVSTLNRYVKRLVITPSRIMFMAPSLMHDNRILREFDQDSAVSCSFQNDDMSSFGGVANSIDFVDGVVGIALRNGVHVAKRHYEFLGCSGSQLRQNGCWLYARDANGTTAADIRTWMGDLNVIRNPGTYLARMGQCFSDTTAVELDAGINIEWHDPDIERGADTMGKPYCFSDGVGRISKESLNEVFMKLDDNVRPSAFQVRLGGSKGMLTLDPNLEGKQILVRDSMFKFNCQHRKVEVMRRAQPTPLFLNCQVITLLSQLHQGISDQVFIRLLNNMLHRLADILLDEEKAKVALSQSGFPCRYGKLHKEGLSFTTDPFFKGVLKAITCARITNVKCRSRIEIPHDYGRAMLGVMDEEGVLEYGQVFFRYSVNIRKPKENLIVHEGPVVISKMPCLHPGDVRKLEAVDHPRLRHLVDCIVFPQKGPRPHPNEMAGSDLDGDEYFVCWYPDLIFEGRNEAPMNFPSIKKHQFDRPITVPDMVKFIVEYIINDKVGMISNAHLAWADKLNIHHHRCTDLARIFCHVIDFNKTGYLPEEVAGKNVVSLLPDDYPGFMGKQDHKGCYTSDKILGKLYSISKRVEAAVSTIDKDDSERIKDGKNWTIDERFLIPGHEKFLLEAGKLYDIYSEYLEAEQRRYGIESEEELVSGCVIKLKGNKSRSDDVYDIEKRLKKRMQDVRKFTKEKFDEIIELASIAGASKTKQENMLAAACYILTYRGKNRHRSFPWIFSEFLLRILQESTEPSPDSPVVLLANSIDKISMDDVQRLFRIHNLEPPMSEEEAKVYYVFLNWGQKSKFLPGEGHYQDQKMLTHQQFVEVLNKIADDDEEVKDEIDAEDSGRLLLAFMRSITSLDEDQDYDSGSLPLPAVINMKRAILLGHHRLAREPDADCLLVHLKQTKISQTLAVNQVTWNKVKSITGELKKEAKEKFEVRCDFRRNRQGGQLHIDGLEQNVIDFTDHWFDTHTVHTSK